MRAAVLQHGRVTSRVVDDPVPGPGQLLVRTLACGICASDTHFMDHPEAGEYDDSGMSTYDQDAEIIMGHEFCAEVVDYGPDTEHRIPLGTRVGSIPILFGASGVKIIGQNPESPGAFGEYFLVAEPLAQVVHSSLPSELVSIGDAVAVGWSAVKRAQITTTEVPMVIGCGAIGLSVIASLKRLGIGPIVGVDFNADRRETARIMGADVVFDPREVGPFDGWRDVASGREPLNELLAAAAAPGCVVFECVGLPGVLDSIVLSCDRGTRIFSVGGPPEGDHLHTMTAKRKGLNIQFGGGPDIGHWNEAFEEVSEGRLDVKPMLGWTVDVDGVAGAIEASRSAESPTRIMVVP